MWKKEKRKQVFLPQVNWNKCAKGPFHGFHANLKFRIRHVIFDAKNTAPPESNSVLRIGILLAAAQIRCGTLELSFHTCKNPLIYATIFWLHSQNILIFQYFHLVGTKCMLNKILKIYSFTRNITKRTFNRLLKANFSPSWVPSKFVIQQCFT